MATTYTISQTAQLLGIGRNRAAQLIRSGTIPAVDANGRYPRVTAATLRDLLGVAELPTFGPGRHSTTGSDSRPV